MVLQLVSAQAQFEQTGASNAESNLRVSGVIDCGCVVTMAELVQGLTNFLTEFSGEFRAMIFYSRNSYLQNQSETKQLMKTSRLIIGFIIISFRFTSEESSYQFIESIAQRSIKKTTLIPTLFFFVMEHPLAILVQPEVPQVANCQTCS